MNEDYRNFHRIRCYFLHLLPHVRPMHQSALSMDFAKKILRIFSGVERGG